MSELVNPLTIPKSDLPLIVLSDNLRSFISFRIKGHTKGFYSHAMIMYEEGMFASQDHVFRSVSCEKYMKDNYRLKFIKIKATEEQRVRCIAEVKSDLSQPWWKRRYDYLGIVGQRTGLRWIQDPYAYYCSELVRKYIQILGVYVKDYPSPADINAATKADNSCSVYGRWYVED